MTHVRTPLADSDLDAIWHYVALDSGNAEIADDLIDSITKRFFLLSSYPNIGRSRDDLRPGTRTFAVGEYLIVYRIRGRDVLILRVLHGRRDISTVFEH